MSLREGITNYQVAPQQFTGSGNDYTVWKYFNEELGIYTLEDAADFCNSFELNIGILGCSKEELKSLVEDAGMKWMY